MKKKIVAIVCGGDSSEFNISVLGAKNIKSELDQNYFTPYLVFISKKGWYVECCGENYPIDKNDFSFTYKKEKVKFDYVFINIHGTPGENGILQSYFDLISMPYSSCGVESSCVTFNKMLCKRAVADIGIPLAKDMIIGEYENVENSKIVSEIGLPMFIKPNASGSSFGVTKVKAIEEIDNALADAFKESNKVIIEEFIEGREFAQGVYSIKGEVFTLPLTEVVSNREFFDYEAKYDGDSNEITPAVAEPSISKKISGYAKDMYKTLNCRGYVRIDFILSNNTPYMIEVNSIPGMSEASIIPQQIKANGMNVRDFLTDIINDTIK